VNPDDTWTEAQDAVYARRVGELQLEGHEEFEIEELAAGEAAREGDAADESTAS
jgi:hypothetical protein